LIDKLVASGTQSPSQVVVIEFSGSSMNTQIKLGQYIQYMMSNLRELEYICYIKGQTEITRCRARALHKVALISIILFVCEYLNYSAEYLRVLLINWI
jgi:hypothetical protein